MTAHSGNLACRSGPAQTSSSKSKLLLVVVTMVAVALLLTCLVLRDGSIFFFADAAATADFTHAFFSFSHVELLLSRGRENKLLFLLLCLHFQQHHHHHHRRGGGERRASREKENVFRYILLASFFFSYLFFLLNSLVSLNMKEKTSSCRTIARRLSVNKMPTTTPQPPLTACASISLLSYFYLLVSDGRQSSVKTFE